MVVTRGGSKRSRERNVLLDRCVPPSIIRALNHFQITVRTLEDVYPGRSQNVQDVEWIRDCGAHQWMGLTQNFRIGRTPIEKAAIVDSGAQVVTYASADLAADTRAMIYGRHLLTIRRHCRATGPGLWKIYHDRIEKVDLNDTRP